MDSYRSLPRYSDRIAQGSHLIPSSPAFSGMQMHLNCWYEIYTQMYSIIYDIFCKYLCDFYIIVSYRSASWTVTASDHWKSLCDGPDARRLCVFIRSVQWTHRPGWTVTNTYQNNSGCLFLKVWYGKIQKDRRMVRGIFSAAFSCRISAIFLRALKRVSLFILKEMFVRPEDGAGR